MSLFSLDSFDPRTAPIVSTWISNFNFSNLRVNLKSTSGSIDNTFIAISGATSATQTDEFYLTNNSFHIETSEATAVSMTMGLLLSSTSSVNPVWIRKFETTNSSFYSPSMNANTGSVNFFLHRHVGVSLLFGNFSHKNVEMNFVLVDTFDVNNKVHKLALFSLAGGANLAIISNAATLQLAHLHFTVENFNFHIGSLNSLGGATIALLSIGKIAPNNLLEQDAFYDDSDFKNSPKYFVSTKNCSITISKPSSSTATIMILQASDGPGLVYEAISNRISANFESTETTDGSLATLILSIFYSIEGMYRAAKITVSDNEISNCVTENQYDVAIARMGGGTSAKNTSSFRLPWYISGNRLSDLKSSWNLFSSNNQPESQASILKIEEPRESTDQMLTFQGALNDEILLSENFFNVTSIEFCTGFVVGCSLIHISRSDTDLAVSNWNLVKNLVVSQVDFESDIEMTFKVPKTFFSFIRAYSSDFRFANNRFTFQENIVRVSPSSASSSSNDEVPEYTAASMKLVQLLETSSLLTVLGWPISINFVCNLDWDRVVFEDYFIGNYSSRMPSTPINRTAQNDPLCQRTSSKSSSVSISRSEKSPSDANETSTLSQSFGSSSLSISTSSSSENNAGTDSLTKSHSSTNHVRKHKTLSRSDFSVSKSTSESLLQSPSQTHQLSPTKSYEKQPLPPPLDTEPFPGASTVIAVTSIFSGNPAAYQLTQKIMLGAKLLNCGNGILEEQLQDSTSDVLKGNEGAIEPLALESNPLGFSIGSKPLDSHRGSMIGNILVCILFALLLALITYFFKSYRKFKTFAEAEKKIHHPGFNAVPLAVMSAATSFSLGIVAGSFGTDLSDGAAGDMTLLIVGTIFMVVVPIGIFTKIFHRCHARERIRVVEKNDYFMIFDEEIENLDEQQAEELDEEEEEEEEKKKDGKKKKDDGSEKKKKVVDEYWDDEELQTKNRFKELTTNLKKQKDRERALQAQRINGIVKAKLKKHPCSPKVLSFRILQYWIVPWKEWRTTTWVKRFAPFIDALEAPYYGLLDLCVPIAIGMASGYSTFCETASCCQGLALFSVIVSAIHLFFFFWIKPFMNRLDVMFGGFGCVATCVQCTFVTAGVFGITWMTEVVEVISQVAGSFGLLIVFFTFLSYAPRMRKIMRIFCKNMVENKKNGGKKKKKMLLKKKKNNQEDKTNKTKNKNHNKTKSLKKVNDDEKPNSTTEDGNNSSIHNNKSSDYSSRSSAASAGGGVGVLSPPPVNLLDLHEKLLKEDIVTATVTPMMVPTARRREDNDNNQSLLEEHLLIPAQQQINDDEDETRLLQEEATITMKDENGQSFALQLEEVDYEDYFSENDEEDEEYYYSSEEEEEDDEDNISSFEGSEYHIDDFLGEQEQVEDEDETENLEEKCIDYSFDEIRNLLGGEDNNNDKQEEEK